MDENISEEYQERKSVLSSSLRENLEARLREMEEEKKPPKKEYPLTHRHPPLRKRSWLHNAKRKVSRKLKTHEISSFCEELALMLSSGMTLVPALRTLSQRGGNYHLRRVIREMGDMIESGATFTEAVSDHEYQFGKFYIAIFEAGERSGSLINALQRVAKKSEDIAHLRHKIISSMIYPVIVVLAALGVIGFAFSYAVPKLIPMIEDMGVGVPWTMQYLLQIGEYIRSGDFWLSLISWAVLVVVSYFVLTRFSAFRLIRDRLAIRIPFLKKHVKQYLVYNFSRVFSTMLSSGVSVPEALEATKETTKNEVLRLTIDRTREAVTEGKRVVPNLVKEKVFPPLAYDMMVAGEETGTLDDVFERVADVYEKKSSNDMEVVGELIKPAIVVVLAIMVGFIVVSLFQTYSEIITQVSIQM